MTDGHLEVAVLADYDEGLLAPPRATEVEDHLAGCASCSAVLGRLGDVRTRLSQAPAEIEMPAAVAARIDHALAAEREQLDREARARARTATVHPFRRRLPQLLAAAATVAAVAFAGYVVSTSGGGDDSGAAVTSAEGGGAESADVDESGAGGGTDLSGEESGSALRVPAPAERTTLTKQIQAIAAVAPADGQAEAEERNTLAPQLVADCGLALADQLETQLIGVTNTDVGQPGAVLVVVETDDPGVAKGFVLPECGAGAAEALRELTVPIE
jgi:hypothetical protein